MQSQPIETKRKPPEPVRYCANRSCQKRLGHPSMEQVRFDTSRGRTAYFCNKACFEKENPS